MSCGCDTKTGKCKRSVKNNQFCWQHQGNRNPEVIIYTLPTCPYSLKAKALLTQHGIPYQEIDVSNTSKRQELIKRTGHRTQPQIFMNGQFLGGYDELSQIY